MSFNRLNYDMCQYKQSIFESTGPGSYMLATPASDCNYCYPSAPTVRLQKAGASIDRTTPIIDNDSELKNLHRPASKCPENRLFSDKTISSSDKKIRPGLRTDSKKYVVSAKDNSATDFGKFSLNNTDKSGLTHWNDCFHNTIESRTVDPASNLRGTGFDRWEYLCFNPQDKTQVPFDFNVANRIIVKDNHRPCVPKPVDPKLVLPPNTGNPSCEKTLSVCGAPTYPASLPCKVNNYYKNS